MTSKIIAAGALLLLCVGIVATLVGCGTTTTKTVTVNHTLAPQTITVPGPTVTQTVTAPPPAQGQVIDTFHGSGNNVTPEFNVPADGNYIVTWTFSNNEFGNGDDSGTNFIVNNTGDGEGTLANDIAVSGHGTGEVQGAGSTDSLTVQAGDGSSWTLTIKSD